ncbi:MAG: hypothetical protein WDO73_18005 [Ignavibacteriota bacterium]
MLVKQGYGQRARCGTLQPAQTVQTPHGASFTPEVLFVKFDNDDIAGWLGMVPDLIIQAAQGRVGRTFTSAGSDSRRCAVAVFGDWGTGLYGAPAIAQSIAGLPRCDVVLHVGDTYYSGADSEVHDQFGGRLAEASRGRHQSLSEWQP